MQAWILWYFPFILTARKIKLANKITVHILNIFQQIKTIFVLWMHFEETLLLFLKVQFAIVLTLSHGSMLKWFSSFLTSYKETVNGCSSILGPLLFILYQWFAICCYEDFANDVAMYHSVDSVLVVCDIRILSSIR